MSGAPVAFPRLMRVRQRYPTPPPLDIPAMLCAGLEPLRARLRPGDRVAVGVGSRGIAGLATLVKTVVDWLRGAGAQPFLVPAMGSHGGGTPEGQMALLADYGITAQAMGAPWGAGMEVESLGPTEDGIEVLFSAEALRAEGILVINRVKPHTDFAGTLGSGLLKMLVVGLGKHAGAAAFHAAAARLGYERVLRTAARVVLRRAPVLAGVAVIEDQRHAPARLAVVPAERLEAEEPVLLEEARRRLPRLPFDEVDLLMVDRLGKNISGTGMDPAVLGRSVHGYSALLRHETSSRPVVRRVFVRDLTPETRGNAVGLGLADFTTTRLVRAMDTRVTYLNSLTALSLNAAKIPMHFDTDHEAIGHALRSLCLPDARLARVVWIKDTLSLETVAVSEAYAEALARAEHLERRSGWEPMPFGPDGNLLPFEQE